MALAVIALVMPLLSPHRDPAAATTSKVHAAGFIAVSRRFHLLARVLSDPYRTNGGPTPGTRPSS
jgi:hypothetical protein